MAVIRFTDAEPPLRIMSPQNLFYGLFFGLGGGILLLVIFVGLIYWRLARTGRIRLGSGAPGELDDEQRLLEEERAAMEQLDPSQQDAYYRAKEFQERFPPESVTTDISLSQFLSIQEKGVSAWEFIPVDLEQSSSVFVQSRTEISFYDDDTEACVQTNLPLPKQNEVYYWEAKLHDKPETTLVSVGLATKPYPSFRLPGWNKHSIAYTSLGQKRFNQPFNPSPQQILHPPFQLYHEGDVVGVGFRPRTGTVFFTRNGKKLEETIHPTFKTHNLFPTIGASGPCSIHINFGQAGFVFIEANVKKWGLAPMSGMLAPPPRYGREDESILLDSGRQHGQNQMPKYQPRGHNRGQSWVSVGGSAARTQTMQSDISLSSLPNNSPPGYQSFSDGGDDDEGSDISQSSDATPRPSSDSTPLVRNRA